MDNLRFTTGFELVVAITAVALTSALALFYFRRVRLERPTIGRFNRRDVMILFVFIVGLPFLYLALPQWLLTCFLCLTFVGALSIGYQPVLRPARLWLTIGFLIGLNLWIARTLLGTVLGWEIFWIESSVIVVAAAVAVSNLYVQGGMQLRHVAWFALCLAVYDAVFTLVWPVTNTLTQRFLGYPLDPSVGIRWGVYNASIGIGDLLVYALFTIAAYKAYGPATIRLTMTITIFFGAIIPACVPLVFQTLEDARTDLIVPAQSSFGPVAFLAYVWLRRRYGRERTTAQFLASGDLARPVTPAAAPPPEPVPATERITQAPV